MSVITNPMVVFYNLVNTVIAYSAAKTAFKARENGITVWNMLLPRHPKVSPMMIKIDPSRYGFQ